MVAGQLLISYGCYAQTNHMLAQMASYFPGLLANDAYTEQAGY